MRIAFTAATAALLLTTSLAAAQPPAPGRGGGQTAAASNEPTERCAGGAAGGGGAGRGGAPGAAAPARGGAPGGAPSAAPGRAGGPPAAGAPARGPAPPPTPATQPRPRDDARHQCFVAQAKDGNIDVLFVGDSITDWWRGPGRGIADWNKSWAHMKAANFAIAGDTTQGVLWRMQNGELKGFRAKVIIFMLGTNNIGRNPPAEIAAGDAMIIREFRKQQPQAKVLVLGVFPRTLAADAPIRAQVREVNYHLSHVADQPNVTYMDIGQVFLTPDGTLTTEIMADGLHPTPRGYELWNAAIMPKVRELLRR